MEYEINTCALMKLAVVTFQPLNREGFSSSLASILLVQLLYHVSDLLTSACTHEKTINSFIIEDPHH